MVKIGNWILFEKKQKTVEEQFKGNVAANLGGKPERKIFYPGQYTWYSRYKHYEKLAEEYPLFNQSCLALAGMVVSQGVFLTSAVNKQDETYALAEEALWRCEKFNIQTRISSKFYETIFRIAKFGSCF